MVSTFRPYRTSRFLKPANDRNQNGARSRAPFYVPASPQSILPATLKPGGADPLDALHDITSEGIHRLSEDERIVRFDKARLVFEYLFEKLEVDKVNAAAFVSDFNALRD